MTRTRRAALTYATGLSYTTVTLLVGIIAVPFLLRWLGEERYGAFRATVDWFGYLALLEFGLAGALRPLIARAASEGDARRVEASMAAGIRAFATMTVPMLLVGLGLALALTTLVPVEVANAEDLRRAGLLMLVTLAFVPLIPFRELAEARQRGYHTNFLLLIQSLVITGTALWLAWRGFGITGQIAAIALGGAVFFGGMTWYGTHRYPGAWRSLFRPRETLAASSALWRLNSPTFIRQIAGRLSVMSDRIIVAWFLGPAMVVPLYVTQRLAELVQSQVSAVGSATWAALAELHTRGEHEVFNQRVVELTRLMAVGAVTFLVPVAIYNQPFVGQWVGADRFGGTLVTAAAAANAFALSIVTMWDWCFSGTGRVAVLVPVSIVSTALNLAVSLTLTPILGIAGPLIGTFVAVTLTSGWYVPVLLRRTFGTSVPGLARAVAVPLAWAVPYTGVVYWVATTAPPRNWPSLLISMTAAPLVFLTAYWFGGLRQDQRDMLKERVRSLIR